MSSNNESYSWEVIHQARELSTGKRWDMYEVSMADTRRRGAMGPEPLSKAFLFSRLLGCFPYSLEGGRVALRRPLLLYCLLIKLFFLPQPIINIFQASFIMSRTKTHTTTATLAFLVAVIFAWLAFVFYFLNRGKLQRVVNQFAVADGFFRRLGQTPYTKVSLVFDSKMVAVVFSLPVIRASVTPRMTWYMVYQLACLIQIVGSVYMLVQPFVRLAANISARLRRTRAALIHVCRSPSDDDLAVVLQLHQVLCSTVRVLNDIYSRNLLFVVFLAFIMITTYIYYSMRTAFNSYTVALIQGIVAYYYSAIICVVAIHSRRISEEVKKFNILLFTLMINDRTEKISNNEKLSLHIAMKNEVVVTACGLFPLDHALIHSMIAAATTYLILLIDYGD